MVTVRHFPPDSGRSAGDDRRAWAACGKASPAGTVAAFRVRRPAGRGPARGGSAAGTGLQGSFGELGVQAGLVALDQEGDRLRRFRALLPCEVVVTALAHPLCGCRVRAYAFRHVDGVPHLKVELPDGMPGLVAADATDVFGAGPAAAGAGLVLDGAGLRHLRAVVTWLRDGDPAREQR